MFAQASCVDWLARIRACHITKLVRRPLPDQRDSYAYLFNDYASNVVSQKDYWRCLFMIDGLAC
jgi:ADP-glucose pyrophosphorylase